MSPDQPPGPIDQLHGQLRSALDAHLKLLSDQFEESLAAARYEVAAEADEAMSARVEAVRGEWSAKLDAELAAAKTEAEQRLAAARIEAEQRLSAAQSQAAQQLAIAQTKAEQRLAEELEKARGEAERRAAAELAAARAQADEAWAAKLDAQLKAVRGEADQRMSELVKARTDAERHWAAKLESEVNHVRGEGEQRLAAAVEGARAEASRRFAEESLKTRMDLEHQAAESAARLRKELEQALAAEREKLTGAQSELSAAQSRMEQERTRLGEEMDALRQRVETIEGERTRAQQDLEAHKSSSQTELDVERQRTAGEIESLRRRLDALQEQLRKAEADVEAERRRAASESEQASREAAERLSALRDQNATQLDDVRRQAAEQLEQARREAREAAEQNRAQQAALDAAATATQLSERQSQLAGFDRMLTAMHAIDESRTLSQALEALLRHAAAAASRGAVFLINGDRLRSWKTVGFPQLESTPFDSALTGAGILAQAVQQGDAVASGPSQPAPTFAAVPPDRVGLAVPLIVGGRPVAVLYADNAGSGEPEAPASWPEAVETLARHASTVLALLTAMRTSQALGLAGSNGEVDEQSARRYARLLVSEIKLYNEAAVKTGRERRDLLTRLRPEIDRARRMYDERVASSVGDRAQYFQQELVQTLADGDPALLGNP
jgi:hypothetical protein